MTLRLLISLSALLFAVQKISAQLAPAEDFFNRGAQLYISNNVPAALERVENGLKTYPDDEKLKKLEQLLKQQQQQQQQQNQSQQQKSDSQKNQQQQKQQEQNSQDQQKQDEQKQADQKKAEQQKQAEQQKSSANKKDGEKPDQQDAAGQPLKPGEMTPEEAKHLLDAQKDSEQLLQMKPQEKPRDPERQIRDW